MTYDVRRSSYCGETYATLTDNMAANVSAHSGIAAVNGCHDEMPATHRAMEADPDQKRPLHGSGVSLSPRTAQSVCDWVRETRVSTALRQCSPDVDVSSASPTYEHMIWRYDPRFKRLANINESMNPLKAFIANYWSHWRAGNRWLTRSDTSLCAGRPLVRLISLIPLIWIIQLTIICLFIANWLPLSETIPQKTNRLSSVRLTLTNVLLALSYDRKLFACSELGLVFVDKWRHWSHVWSVISSTVFVVTMGAKHSLECSAKLHNCRDGDWETTAWAMYRLPFKTPILTIIRHLFDNEYSAIDWVHYWLDS